MFAKLSNEDFLRVADDEEKSDHACKYKRNEDCEVCTVCGRTREIRLESGMYDKKTLM